MDLDERSPCTGVTATPADPPRPARRTVLRCVVGISALGAAGGLAACGTDDPAGGGEVTPDGAAVTPDGAEVTPDGAEVTPDGAEEASDGGLVATADVPVGGGVILDDVVVTQPSAGQFAAFDSTCTHQGCQVSGVADGTINCSCHGSRFSLEDGSVQQGPATAPLPEVAVTVAGDQVMRA